MKNNNLSGYVSAVPNQSKISNVIDITKDDFLKYGTKADNLRISGQYKESIAYYLQSALLNRNNAKTYLGLAQSYKFLNNYDKALENLKKSEKIDPNNYEIYYEMGICYLLKANPDKAIECFQKSILVDNTKLDVQLQLALAHEVVDEPDIGGIGDVLDVGTGLEHGGEHLAHILGVPLENAAVTARGLARGDLLESRFSDEVGFPDTGPVSPC